MKDRILVIGGYGQVGRVICRQLSVILPGKIIAAGRSYQKAEEFASSTGGKVIPIKLDIYDLDSVAEILQDIRLVIMCLDQKDNGFVKKCLDSKTHYIDISPSYKTLAQIESLSEMAEDRGVTAVLGVGLAPGLSNMLVKYISSQYDRIDEADIFLMLGIGERHGRDGIEWLLNHIQEDFEVVENGMKKRVKSFSDKKKSMFPGHLGKRTAYRFDLADQHIVPKTMGIKSVSSRFCYDSVFITHEMAILKALGIFHLIKSEFLKKTMINIFDGMLSIFAKLHIGSDVFAVKIDAKGINKCKEAICNASIIGNNNTELTGMVAKFVAEKVFSNPYSPGIYYLEQLFEPEELIGALSSYMRFSFTESRVIPSAVL